MRKAFFILSILLFVNLAAFAQERSNASTYGNTQSRPTYATGDLSSMETTKDVTEIYFLEATVLMNVKADEYVASFGVQGEAATALQSEQMVDSKMDALKAKLAAVGITETFVDFINQAPFYEYDASGKTATEKLKGYKTAKNILIRYKDRNALRKITNSANEVGIYDLIKIDFVINDFSGIKSRMMTEAAKIIKSKEQTYSTLGINLKPVGAVYEKFQTFAPDELYQDYTAYESGNTQGYKRVIQKSKASTSYYSGFDGKDFDLTINPSSLEPNTQAVMYLKVKYLPTNFPPKTECCAENKPK
ncbi:MAG: SIMPL domain-containing protein [Pyrinomonadaceae bacterium]|nr:SIMPL domain-containing protein [Pyrinomonadaceae bacterium]